MILIKIKHSRELKKKHWKWFCGILNDSDVWVKNNSANSTQPINPDLCKQMTREKFIKTVLKLKTRREIRNIVLANYSAMRKMIKKHPEWVYSQKSSSYGVEVRDGLKKAFGYEDVFCKTKNSWNAFEFYNSINVDVCPYCNSQPVGADVVRDEVEHFFPRGLYPFLSITLLNMIPVCKTCNGNKLKHDTYKEEIVYPYKKEFGKDGQFFIGYDLNAFFQGKKNFKKSLGKAIDFTIKKYDSSPVSRTDINNSIKCLKLTSEYKIHAQDQIKNLLVECQSRVVSRASYLSKWNFPREQILKQLSGGFVSMSKKEHCFRKMREDVLEQIETYMKIGAVYAVKKNIIKRIMERLFQRKKVHC